MKKTVSLLLTMLMMALMLSMGVSAYADDTEPATEDVVYYTQKIVETIPDINTADTAPGYDEFFGETDGDEPESAETPQASAAPESEVTEAAASESPATAEPQKPVPAAATASSGNTGHSNISITTVAVLVIVAGLVGASAVLLVEKK